MTYACKACYLRGELWGERFQETETWFQTPEELAAHWRQTHPESFKIADETAPNWPCRLEDAQAIAAGYIVCCANAECTHHQFICLRCNAVHLYTRDVMELYCLSCGRRYENYYRLTWNATSL